MTKQRILNESRNLAKIHKCGINTPYVLFVDLVGRKIYMEYIENSSPMKNILRKIYETNDFSTKYGVLIQNFITSLAEIITKLHNNNVIHGDLTTSNILIVKDESNDVENDILKENSFSCLYLIDFGLSFTSVHIEDKAVDLYVLKRAVISSNPKSEEVVRNFFI